MSLSVPPEIFRGSDPPGRVTFASARYFSGAICAKPLMMNEASQQDTGLPWLWLLKGTLLVFVFAVGLQGVSMLARSLATILSPATDDGRAPDAAGGA